MLQVREITLLRGAKVVLAGAGMVLHAGEKVGLIGRNGAGKSSLFSLLAGRLHADRGDVEMPPRWQRPGAVGEVAQEMPETSDDATAFVLAGDGRLMQAQAALAAAEDGGDGHAIADAHLALDEAGAFDARSRAQALLLGLGFRNDELERPVNSFSGGWRMRLQLARALMCPSELLLLDEPTNHLDLDALVWLESWLKRYEGLLIVISHDREFLDAVCKVIVHLDDAKLTRYGGNYTAFEEQRAERMTLQQSAFEKQQERIAHLQRFIDRFKAKATKAKQAQSRVKALARMERLAPVLTAGDFEFEFREPASLPNPMLVFDGLDCGYVEPPVAGYGDTPPEGVARALGRPGAAGAVPAPKVIVHDVSRSVLAGQRIGILGANGQGKSTLVKTIAGVLPPLGGRMTAGKGLALGYFAQQELDLLRLDEGPLQHMVRLARDAAAAGTAAGQDTREQALRDHLGRFRFGGEMVGQPVGTLSGGEKARLVLAMLVWQRPNLLLLDEPTNHLDLTTREALSIALNEFEGTVLLVSHDRALLREVCDEFWLVTRGGVQPFDGDLDDYQRWLLEVARAAARGGVPPPLPGTRGVPPPLPGTRGVPPPLPGTRGVPPPPGNRGEAPPSAARAAAPSAHAAAPRPSPAPPTPKRDDRKASAQVRAELANRTRPLRAELAQIDTRLARLAAERTEIEGQLSAPDVAGADIAELGRRLNHTSAEIAMLEERWLALQEQLDLMAQG